MKWPYLTISNLVLKHKQKTSSSGNKITEIAWEMVFKLHFSNLLHFYAKAIEQQQTSYITLQFQRVFPGLK